MLIWGILGLLQSVLLPGLIILKVVKIRGGILERMIYCFPLSLISNYLAVFTLTALGIYIRPVVVGLLFLEFLVLSLLFRDDLQLPFSRAVINLYSVVQAESKPFLSMLPSGNDAGGILRFILWFVFGSEAVSAVFWGLHVCSLNVGTVFSGLDTLFSWNTYAESWAQNLIPQLHGAYPQLVPANWSLSYLLQGDGSVQLFNTLIPPVFFLLIFVMLFDLGFQKKETGFFIAALIARYMMKKLMGDQISDGYMDVPAAFMSFLVVYTLLKGMDRDKTGQEQAILLAILFASGAAVTKQVGFIILILTPFLIRFWLKDAFKSINRKSLFSVILISFLMIVPWYLLCLVNSRSVDPASGELLAVGIRRFNESYEWSHKLLLARQALGKYGVFFLLSIIGLPLIPKKYRLPFLLCSWPLVLVWAAFFTYDARNLACALPFIAASSGFVVNGVFVFFEKILKRIGAGRIAIWLPFALLLIAILAGLWLFLPEEELSEIQKLKQRDLFGKGLNQELLYGHIGEEHHDKDILTDYPAYFLSGYEDCCEMVDFSDVPVFEKKLDGENIRYVLGPQLMQNISWDTALVLERCTQSGRCSLVGCSYGYYEPYCLYSVAEPGN
ncbi:MAG: hypothetical protein AB9907_12395 [Flexilinea sp.]